MRKVWEIAKLVFWIIVLNIVFYFFAEGVLWLDSLLKVRTHVGTIIATWGVHFLFFVLATMTAFKWYLED